MAEVTNFRAVQKKKTKILRNYDEVGEGKSKQRLGRDPEDVYGDFKRLSPDWPKNVKNKLVVYQEGRRLEIRQPHDLFAWVQNNAGRLDWHSGISSAISKSEFTAFVDQRADCYDDATALPHFPPIPKMLYLEPPPEPRASGALDTLLGYFLPATDLDRDLLKAAFLTPFWGGCGGERPAFVLTGKEDDSLGGRGVGKTKLVDVIADLAGGLVELSLATPIDDAKKRLLTTKGERIVRFDNVKASKLSSADLEGLITAPHISGHQMYSGDGKIPNYFTFFITFNDASFSRDMAQRAVPIVLNRPIYGDGWELRISDFIAARRGDIMSDIAYIYSVAACDFPAKLRFPRWAKEVLFRATANEKSVIEIQRAQKALDDDDEQAELMEEVIMRNLGCYLISGAMGPEEVDPTKSVFIVRKSLVFDWLRQDLKLPPTMSQKAMSTIVKRGRPPCLRPHLGSDYRHGHDNTRCFLVWKKDGGKFTDCGQPGGETVPAGGYLVLEDHRRNKYVRAVDIPRTCGGERPHEEKCGRECGPDDISGGIPG